MRNGTRFGLQRLGLEIADIIRTAGKTSPGPYVNTGPEHMPLGIAERKAHDARLAERGERDES